LDELPDVEEEDELVEGSFFAVPPPSDPEEVDELEEVDVDEDSLEEDLLRLSVR